MLIIVHKSLIAVESKLLTELNSPEDNIPTRLQFLSFNSRNRTALKNAWFGPIQ